MVIVILLLHRILIRSKWFMCMKNFRQYRAPRMCLVNVHCSYFSYHMKQFKPTLKATGIMKRCINRAGNDIYGAPCWQWSRAGEQPLKKNCALTSTLSWWQNDCIQPSPYGGTRAGKGVSWRYLLWKFCFHRKRCTHRTVALCLLS